MPGRRDRRARCVSLAYAAFAKELSGGAARCDGREDLARKLAQHRSDPPHAASSKQLILNAFSKFGEAALPELNGDFSFVLWNPRRRKNSEKQEPASPPPPPHLHFEAGPSWEKMCVRLPNRLSAIKHFLRIRGFVYGLTPLTFSFLLAKLYP
jgi:hypothetical protein